MTVLADNEKWEYIKQKQLLHIRLEVCATALLESLKTGEPCACENPSLGILEDGTLENLESILKALNHDS